MSKTECRTLTDLETQELLREVRSKEVYKMINHSWRTSNFGKQYCSTCGLVALNNKITGWCIDKGCNHEDHPQYNSTLKRLTRSVHE